jgi:hypothetical protein
MREDAASKAERYRREANKYGELAKQAEPDYLAAFYRKIAVRYVYMAEDVLKYAERSALRTQYLAEHAPSDPSDFQSDPSVASPSRMQHDRSSD